MMQTKMIAIAIALRCENELRHILLFTRTTSQSPRLRETLATVTITRGNSRSVFSLVLKGILIYERNCWQKYRNAVQFDPEAFQYLFFSRHSEPRAGKTLHFILARSMDTDVFQKDVEEEYSLRPPTATKILKDMERMV